MHGIDIKVIPTTHASIFANSAALAGTIHGDAHFGNVLITPHGARWNDFEDVSLGPRE